MFRVKICGITNIEDARIAADAGADAIGLNFFEGSPRCIDLPTAGAVSEALPASVERVGLFVNHGAARVLEVCAALRLDWIQLHGDEPPEFLAELRDAAEAPRRILRGLRLGAEGLQPVADYLDRCRQLGCAPDAVLLDAGQPGLYGGTGTTCDWTQAATYGGLADAPPLVLAGGLNPENVADGVAAVRPQAVDTASGVETAPGCKDAERVRAFVAAARAALARV